MDEQKLPGISTPAQTTSLGDIARLFLKLGTIGFGGPAAHIAMMEDEVVRRRGWLTRERFVDLLGVTNIIPGPNSTELAIHIGFQRRRWAGLLTAGTCFILPAALIVGVIAWSYRRYGALPEVDAVMYGVKPVIIAIVVQAMWRLMRSAIKSMPLGVIAVIAAVLNFAGVHELIVLFGAAFAAAGTRGFRLDGGRAVQEAEGTQESRPGEQPGNSGHDDEPAPPAALAGPLLAQFTTAPAAAAAPFIAPVGLGPIFLFFLKVGAVLYGSGYVLLAFLRADLVDRWGWLTEAQLLDAIAIGQVTPGPLFTTATFIGYLLGGPAGAVVATVGIFLPALFFVALTGPFVDRIRVSPTASALLDGLNVASLALLVVVAVRLGGAAIVDAPTMLIGAGALFLALRFKLNSAWLVCGGAAIGISLRHLLG